jgi:SWI/SNF-related matrix-associated actin-dependent regulator 1 of chromatin subfamily A
MLLTICGFFGTKKIVEFVLEKFSMGFRSNSKSTFRPKVSKGPIRLSFGIVENKNPVLTQPVCVEPPQIEKRDIVGTLTLKKIKLDQAPPLPQKHLTRIITNIQKIYEEGRFSNTNTLIDYENDHLKVTFHYNQNRIDRIKGLDRNERQWDPDSRAWKIFVGCFDDLFDILGKGFQITEQAYEKIIEFVKSLYYANIASSKIGKLILRENWFEELDLTSQVSFALPQKSTHLDVTASQNQVLCFEKIKEQISQFAFQRKPYSHQITGIEFLLRHPACALLDEMGCGKSFQIATSVAILLKNKIVDRCLIVAPKSLVKTWENEISLATQFSYTVIAGTPLQRSRLLKNETPIFIIHYEGMSLEKEVLAQWMQGANSIVVFDESQRIKNLHTQTTLSAKYVRNFAKRCIIATGTPIANRPLDLFAQYYVMDNGATFGSRFSVFKNTFCYIDHIEITQGRKKIKVEKFIGVRNGEELKKRVLSTSLRRLKNDVLDLPPIVYKDYSIELKSDQKTIYAKVRDSVRNEIENMSSEEYLLQATNIVVRLLRLSQIASNPKLIDAKYTGSNAKLTELGEILTDIFSDKNKKIILWSHFVTNVKYLQEIYSKQWGAVAHTGEMSLIERNQNVEEFQNNPHCRLFIATPQSAKEGLTLLPKDKKMMADTMIYMDLNFDSGSYLQSQARFHRIGQSSDKCLIIHLIGQNTVDEYIKKVLHEKMMTASKILDHTNSQILQKDQLNAFRPSQTELLDILSSH